MLIVTFFQLFPLLNIFNQVYSIENFMGNYVFSPAAQTKRLIIIRGLPGSGKAVLASQLKDTYGQDSVVYSTDDYFIDPTGEYKLKLNRIKVAHLWNQNRTMEAMKEGKNTIIINNCNARKWEAKPYVETAIKFGYTVEIQEPNTAWKRNIPELINRSNGRYSPKFVHKMNSEWDTEFTVESILASTAPWEHNKDKRAATV